MNYYSTSSKGIGGRIKRRISDFLVEEIAPDGEVCRIRAFSDKEKRHLKKQWPEKPEGKDQLILTLEKFNLDLNFAIRKIARFLQTSRKRIGYAGMKDKRAISSQRISIWKPDLERLGKFESRYIDLRDASWSSERIEIGMLKGNKFEVTVREIDLSKEECKKRIEECLKEMKKGIANYFGEQRFGGIRQVTHLVGKEFVNGNIKKGVMLYLTATAPGEEPDIKNARMCLAKTNNFPESSKQYPVKYRYERAIIHHLCKYPNDFAGAFRKLPKPLRYMFTHAYQSYLFNRIIDRRIEKGIGLKRVKDDILDDKGNPTAPLLGFESKLAAGIVGEIEKEILEEESTDIKNFKIREMAELSSKGTKKSIVLKPERLRLLRIEKDELNEGKLKATVSFRLSKGNYATTVLRELMKNE